MRTNGRSAMSIEDHKTLVRTFYEQVWNRGNVEVAREIFAGTGRI